MAGRTGKDPTPPKRVPGRPRIHTQPMQRITLELPADLVARIDALVYPYPGSRTAWIFEAIEQRLARSQSEQEPRP